MAYTEVEQEQEPAECGKPPAAWPTSGEIKVENLSARYSKVSSILSMSSYSHVYLRRGLRSSTDYPSIFVQAKELASWGGREAER